MFDFFRRKKPEEAPERTPLEDAPASEAPAAVPAEEETLLPPVATPVRDVDLAPEPSPVETAEPDTPRRSWSERLRAGLGRSREKLSSALGTVFSRRTLDEETLEELETALLMADVGVAATEHLLQDLRRRARNGAAHGGRRRCGHRAPAPGSAAALPEGRRRE
jgi:fused signal recognition particle receptor